MKNFEDHDKEELELDEAKGLEGTLRKLIPGYGKRMALDRNAAHWEVVRQMSAVKKQPEDKVRAKSLRHFKAAQKYSNILLSKSITEQTKESTERMKSFTQIIQEKTKEPTVQLEAIGAKDKQDEGEYGYEGDMAMSQLRTIIRNSEEMMKVLKKDTDLPEWVQSKITLATDYLQTANDYLMSELEEEVEQIEEIHAPGTKVNIPHKGKSVTGKVVRYDKGAGGYSPAYVVHVSGEYESPIVPAHKVKKVHEEVEQIDEMDGPERSAAGHGNHDPYDYKKGKWAAAKMIPAKDATKGIDASKIFSALQKKKKIKEESEQIDEISKDMATRYMRQIERQPGLDNDHPDKRKPSRFGSQKVGYERAFNKVSPYGRRVKVKATESVEQIDEAPAWQRKEGKNPEGGLNQKGVDSYRAENPGSKLQTAVTTEPSKLKKGSKAAKRRLSFCRRMKGMKEKLTSAETARDPDSRINKSLRKWNC